MGGLQLATNRAIMNLSAPAVYAVGEKLVEGRPGRKFGLPRWLNSIIAEIRCKSQLDGNSIEFLLCRYAMFNDIKQRLPSRSPLNCSLPDHLAFDLCRAVFVVPAPHHPQFDAHF